MEDCGEKRDLISQKKEARRCRLGGVNLIFDS